MKTVILLASLITLSLSSFSDCIWYDCPTITTSDYFTITTCLLTTYNPSCFLFLEDEDLYCAYNCWNTFSPTTSPTSNPTFSPTTSLTSNPTFSPTTSPTSNPTLSPTSNPTETPTSSPTNNSSSFNLMIILFLLIIMIVIL